MLRLAIKNLAQNKIRLALTSFAIVLGVGFVVSSFVLRDGLKEVFADLSEQVVAGIDIGISAEDPNRDPVTQADFDAIAGLDGIGAIELQMTSNGYENQLQPVKPDGETISLQGPPQIVFSWSTEPAFDVTDILEGEAPLEEGQWVIDEPSRAEHGFVIGDDYTFVTPSGQQQSQLVGTFTFDGFIEGPTFMSMQTENIREWMLFDDRFDFIAVAIDGSVPVADLQTEIDQALNPDGSPRLLVQDQESLIADTQAEFNQALDIIGGILLGFALLSLFVSIFIIANTFAITTSQRTRELGLLRAVGATGSQVLRSVIAESFIIGALSSLIGIGVGVLIAFGLRAILNSLGLGIPSFGVVVLPATILYAVVVGVVVTVLAAIVPAIKASRTPPITAISGRADAEAKSIGRFVIGAVITAAGIALMLFGLFGGGDDVLEILVPLGAGAAILFIGITLLSPLVSGPLSQVLGTPLARLLGTPGRLARENSARNPRRTATTAAALMIGLSLVSMASVLGESFRAQFDDILNTSVQADFLVISDQADIPDDAVELIAESPAFGNVTPIKYWSVRVENELIEPARTGDTEVPEDALDESLGNAGVDIGALDYDQIDGLFDFEVIEGSLTDIDDDSAGIRDPVAELFGLGLGDTVQVFDLNGEIIDLEIVAIYEDVVVSAGLMVSFDRFDTLSPQLTSDWVAAQVADGVTVEEADAEFDAISNEFPNLAFQSSAEFRQSFSDQISFILNLLTVLLALTIVIAVLGIANTLALSVFERTREIGLLRAVGMTRGQTRKMIRWEGVIIAAVGAVLGTVLGVALGALIVNAIPDEFISAFAIPWVRIGIMVAVTSVMGLLAALFPAWRASRMNVLEAISHA